MIPSLPQLWLATAYALAVAAAVRSGRRRAYVGRHRQGVAEGSLSQREAEAAAVQALAIAAHAALRGPTVDMLVPDVDSDVKPYQHSAGVGRYVHLRPLELEAKAEHDRALADMGIILRSPFAAPVDDEWVEMAT